MKIISKYKDYYDYLVGIYGIDEKLVLDRTKFDIPSYSNVVTFYICGKCIDGYYDAKDERFYFGDDILKKFPKKEKRYSKWYLRIMGDDTDDAHEVVHITVEGSRFGQYANLTILDDKRYTNEKMGCPIMCSGKVNYNQNPTYYHFPKLDETGIAKMLPPHEIYMLLNKWLGKDKVFTDNRTNEEKILSAGFDKKISFRNIK
jgi:hypothetical protein